MSARSRRDKQGCKVDAGIAPRILPMKASAWAWHAHLRPPWRNGGAAGHGTSLWVLAAKSGVSHGCPDHLRALCGVWLSASLRAYSASWVPGYAIAEVTLAAIAIPEQLATARLAGMPPMAGLLAFAAGSLAFAAFGASRFLSVGADSTIAPI